MKKNDLKYKLNIQHFNDLEAGEEGSEPNLAATKTFSQEDINKTVKATKIELEAKFSNTLKDLGIEDIETFKTAQKQKDDELNTLKTKDIKLNKAIEYGLGMDVLDLISGTDEESIAASAKKLSEYLAGITTKSTDNTNITVETEKNVSSTQTLEDAFAKKVLGGKQ